MGRDVIVEFGREGTESGEPRPRDRREIVVLVMIPHIVREDVQRAVIAVSLLFQSVPEVMLCNEVAGTGVEASSEEAAHDEVDEGSESEGRDEDIVEDELDDDVDEMPLCELLGSDERGSEGIEEDLECAGEGGW